MSVNPNVDRLSIDERLRKLEARFPGGGGGGGSFGGTLPDFDQFPDNAIKLTNEGMVIKFSFDNVGTTFNCQYYQGMELKCCVFMPYYSGILSYPYFVLARTRFKNNLNDFKLSSSQSFNGTIPFDFSDFKDHVLYTDTYLAPFFGVALVSGGMMGNNRVVSFAPMNFTGSNTNLNSPNLQFSMNVYKNNLSGSGVSPCYNFGAAAISDTSQGPFYGSMGRPVSLASGLFIGGLNSGQNISVIDLNNLPAQIRNIYPQSWVTP